MKAGYIEGQGGPEVMQYGDQPDPVAGPGEVVIDIHAASVNGADWKVRAGSYGALSEFPHILGRDCSGVVSAVGEGVTDIALGDAVFVAGNKGHALVSTTPPPTLISYRVSLVGVWVRPRGVIMCGGEARHSPVVFP